MGGAGPKVSVEGVSANGLDAAGAEPATKARRGPEAAAGQERPGRLGASAAESTLESPLVSACLVADSPRRSDPPRSCQDRRCRVAIRARLP